jgi:hypothetical protein
MKISGRKRQGVTTGWRRLQREVKVKLSLFLLKHKATKIYGCGGIASYFLITAQDALVSFTPRPLYLKGKIPDTYCVGGEELSLYSKLNKAIK